MEAACHSSAFGLPLFSRCVIGATHSEKDLKATFYYSSIGFE